MLKTFGVSFCAVMLTVASASADDTAGNDFQMRMGSKSAKQEQLAQCGYATNCWFYAAPDNVVVIPSATSNQACNAIAPKCAGWTPSVTVHYSTDAHMQPCGITISYCQ